jgi:phage terminase large subunit-like protein
MRELKKKNLLYTTALLSKLYSFVDSFPDIAELAKKASKLDGVEFQKIVVDELVNWTKNKQENTEE